MSASEIWMRIIFCIAVAAFFLVMISTIEQHVVWHSPQQQSRLP